MRYLTADRLSLRLSVSEELSKSLKRIQDIESQKQQKSVTLEQALEVMAKVYLEKHDPLRRAERAEQRSKRKAHSPNGESSTLDEQGFVPGRNDVGINTESNPESDASVNSQGSAGQAQGSAGQARARPRLPSALIHAVHLRDGKRCTHIDANGKRCANTRFLETHHIRPREFGGADVLENLATLCGAHHRLLHLISSAESGVVSLHRLDLLSSSS
jgi:hypothetical protein